jgi:hypothetical protein
VTRENLNHACHVCDRFALRVVVNVAHSWLSHVLHAPFVTLTLLHTYPLPSLAFVRGMGVQFGSFDSICQTAALVICPLLGSDQGIEPTCYSRNVDLAGTLIFQPCELFSPFASRRSLSTNFFIDSQFSAHPQRHVSSTSSRF